MNYFHLVWPYAAKALEATAVSIEIAVVGAIIALLQLDYAKKRDATLDARNQWEKIHRAMMEFRFRREVFNIPGDYGLSDSEAAVEMSHALHMLRGELDRAPNSPLVADIWAYLDANAEAEQWRAAAFVPGFDNLVHQVALKSR
jgi:hypothetical protein